MTFLSHQFLFRLSLGPYYETGLLSTNEAPVSTSQTLQLFTMSKEKVHYELLHPLHGGGVL